MIPFTNLITFFSYVLNFFNTQTFSLDASTSENIAEINASANSIFRRYGVPGYRSHPRIPELFLQIVFALHYAAKKSLV